MKVHHLSFLAITLAITSPRYSVSESTHNLFSKVNHTNVPHQGCLLLLKDRQPPQSMLVGEEFERRGSGDYRVNREAGATSAQCRNGMAGGYPCNNVDLLSMFDIAALSSALGSSNSANDIWGWTDTTSGREFAIIGIQEGTAFVEITDPNNPIYVGALRTKTSGSSWRDIKTFGNYAFIVSEASNHGMQIIDLTVLLTATPGTELSESAHYGEFSTGHNIFINEDTGFAYAVGSNTCSGGLHMMDINTPLSPSFVGCYSSDFYTHDVQCVTYKGPDSTYTGREICFCSNEDTITVVDVTEKTIPTLLSKKGYSNDRYTHQGWLTEDHSHFIFNDELDELNNVVSKTTTHVMDVSDLNNINYVGFHSGRTSAIDHNNYVRGNYLYQANYRAGLNVLKITGVANAEFEEVGYFDVWPASDSSSFNGAWSNYPYFPSGTIIVSSIEGGLFVLRFNDDGSTPGPTPLQTSAPTSLPTACGGTSLTVELTTDNYPSETAWTVVRNSNGAVVMFNPTMSSDNAAYTTSGCLVEDCYLFEITDAANDGICCAFGEGSVSLILGTEILSVDYFTDRTTVDFCTTGSTPTSAPSASPTTSPTTSSTKTPTKTPTPKPTETPIAVPTAEPLDNPDWTYEKSNGKVVNCNWIKTKTAKNRCKKVGLINNDEVRACDACRAACIDRPCVTTPPCEGDNPDWVHVKGNNKEKDCDWIGRKSTKKRCKGKKGLINGDGEKVKACEACCDTCSDHPCK